MKNLLQERAVHSRRSLFSLSFSLSLFFGSIQIISLILSNPLVLIYSQSGAGKTSLFNTKITYELEQQYKFQTFPSARVRSLLSTEKIPENVDNMYMFNILQ